jgi:hypothetical protein
MGARNLWELVDVVMGTDDMLLSNQYKSGIMHMKHITKYKAVSQHIHVQLFDYSDNIVSDFLYHKPKYSFRPFGDIFIKHELITFTKQTVCIFLTMIITWLDLNTFFLVFT